MPAVKIEIRKGKSDEYKKAILDGVHDALVEAIKIPDYDSRQKNHGFFFGMRKLQFSRLQTEFVNIKNRRFLKISKTI